MWEIKGKDNQTKATVYALEYNGEWMGESYVSVTIESPTPIAFAIGDYLMYRGERFEINYDPGKIKSAPPETKGDAFKYENIKFNSLADELTRCDFLDVVLEDNQLHFTGLPKFSFYGGVHQLASRIQANLDRTYPNQWTVVVSPEYSGTKELNVSVDTQKVWDALSILVNDFETYFTIKGRTITIGAAGIPAAHLFKYGKGDGLYEIEQNAEADQAIVTRLRAYGSTRNLPHRYYNSLTGADGQKLIPDNMAVQNLMLPSFPYTTQDPYIDSANKAALGIREGTIFFDGSQEGLEEIYPSIEGMTAEQLKAAGVPCNSTGALDVIVSAEQMTDDGVGDINEGETETTATPPTFKVTLPDIGFDINDHLTTETATLSFKTGMLGGREFEIVGCEAIKDSADKVTGYELELNRVYDDGIKLWFPYKDYNAKAGDKITILHISMPEVYIKAAAQRLLEAATAWLAKNDYSRSVYAPKVDEIFMARQHDEAMASGGSIVSLHDTLKEGMMLLFEDDDLNIDASIFIDQLIIKEGDGPIPTYEITLKEEKTVGRLDKMQNQIDSLAAGQGQGSGGYNASQIRSLIDAYGGTRFLSRIKDDRTAHKLASDKAFEVGEFLAGISGGFFGIDQNGDSYLEVARLYARVRAVFEELTVIKTGVLAGKQYITPGGGIVCTKVEEVTNASGTLTGWRCYFLSEQDGEKTECKFIVNDQAISAVFNAKPGTANKVSNHRYWRLVTAVDNDAYTDDSGNHYGYIELSAADCEAGSDTPQAGDEICQFGYRGTDEPRRQTAMVFSTVDADAPSIKLFRGINSYTLEGKAVVQFGVDAQTGKVFFRLGASNATHFLDYTEAGGLQVAGKISTLSTLDDTNTTLGTAINSKVEDTDVLWRLHTSQTDAPALPVLGADGTITDYKGWQTDAPAVVSGQFVWTTTYVRYGNGTAKFDGTACVTGRDGKDGKDGVTMTSEVVEYAIGTSGTVAPTSGWSTTIPAVPKGQYQWTRVTTTYSDGTPTVSYSVAYIPKDGEDGADGANGAGYSVNLVLQSDEEVRTPNYQVHRYYTSEDLVVGETYTWTFWGSPGAGRILRVYATSWLSTSRIDVPKKADGVYSVTAVWNADPNHHNTITNAFDLLAAPNGATTETVITKVKVEKGANPNPVWTPAPLAIVSTSITYAKNTTGIQPPDASFTATAIGQLGTISGGDYIWSKTEVTYTDGTVLKSYAVSRIGSDGETQIAGLHIAYATGITGSLPHPTAVTGFSTTMVAGVTYKYIGIRKDNSTADSTNFADYDWAEFRGSDGQNGASYSNNMLVGTKDWSGWTTDNVFTKDGTYEGLDVMHGVSQVSGFHSLAIASAITLEANTVYTLSMWAKGTGRFFSYVWPSVTARIINIDGVDSTSIAGDTKAEHTLSTAWKRYFVVFRTLSGSTLIDKNVIAARLHAGDGEVWIAGAKIEKGDNRTPTWSPHPSEMVATPAKLVIVNAPQLVFTYENNFATIVGVQQIVLQSTLQGTTGRQWSYRPGSASGFTDYPNATSETFTVPHNNSTYFPNGAKSCTFRCTSGDVYDEVTIYKVSSGSNGVDGANYTENLVLKSDEGVRNTNYEMHRYYLSEDLVVGETYTWTIWGVPAEGKYFRIYPTDWVNRVGDPLQIGDGVRSIVATWTGGGSNALQNAFVVLAYPHEPLGESVITKVKVEKGSNPNPVWTPAPADGDGITVILTNESHVFEGDTEKAVTGAAGCGVIAYKGATQVVAHIGTITGLAVGMSATIYNNDTITAAFTVYVNPSLTQRQGTLTIPVTVEGKTFTKIFSWSVSLEGQPGKDARRIAVKSDGYGGSITGGYGYVKVDGTNVRTSASCSSRKRGLTIVTLNRSTLAKVEETYYDLYSGNSAVATARTNFINYINGLSSDVFACITFCDNITWTTEMVTAMKLLGSLGDIRTDGQNRTFAFLGYKGLTPGYSLQAQGENAKTPLAEVSAYVADGMFTTAKTQVGTKKLTEEYALSASDTVAPTSGWSETKQPWEAGKFYWTRIKIEYTDGTIEYTTPICATGSPGKDALRLDLTNEMAGVICNSAGTVTGAYPTSQASVYKGSTKLTSGVSYSATPKTGIDTVSITTAGVITMSDMTADKAEITVQAVVDGTTLTTTMTLYKVKPGADGQPATVYQIEPSTNVIKRDMAGTPHPTTLTVTKYRTTGTATRQTTNEYFLYAWQTDANGIYVMSPVVVAGTSAATATIQIAPTAVEVGFELRPVADTNPNVPVLDRETVPVITDSGGTGIDPRNLALSSGNWNIPAGELSWPNPLEPDWARLNNGCVTRITTDGKLQLYKDSGSDRNGLTEEVSVKNIPSGTILTLHVKGSVSGLTSGKYVDWMLYRNSDWGHSTLFKKITANGNFDFAATVTLGAAYDNAVICHRLAQANSGTTITIEHVGLYNGVILPAQWAPAPEDGNYLLRAIQKAKQDTTVIDGGLILATLLQLGVTDVNGVRKIMSGISGICNGVADPAIWMGGDMVDRANNPLGLDPAKGMFRHDATGYLANGVIQFVNDGLEIIDPANLISNDKTKVRLDKDGLHLIDSTGRQKLRVANVPVGGTLAAGVSRSFSSSGSAAFAYSASGSIKLAPTGTGWNRTMNLVSTLPVSSDNATATLTLNMAIITQTGWTAPSGTPPYFEWNIKVNYTSGPAEEFTHSGFGKPIGNGTNQYSFSFNFHPAKGRTIRSVQVVNEAIGMTSGATTLSVTAAYSGTVAVTYGYPDCTLIGNNGFQAVQNGARLLCYTPDGATDGESEMSFTGTAGTFGQKVTGSGFKYITPGMSDWAAWNPAT